MDAIVAVYSDWGIGADGTQPVILKADRQHFVELTRGRTVIVGRRTLADFPGGRPLKGRRNIVLTRGDTVIDGAEIAHSAAEAAEISGADAMVLGGQSVFRDMMPYIDRVFVTKINCRIRTAFLKTSTRRPTGASRTEAIRCAREILNTASFAMKG